MSPWKMEGLTIGARVITRDSGPYLIAEIGLNHEGDLARAKDLIWQAKRGGADAAKFQALKADTIAHPNSPTYFHQTTGDHHPPAMTQHAFFARSDGFGPAEFASLATTCRDAGLDFLCTPFSVDAVSWVAPLVPAWKVASADITNEPLLDAIGATGKPVLLSTGAATLDEISHAESVLWRAGGAHVAFLHCVLAYPTPPDQANLGAIPAMARAFPWAIIGYSDHTVATPEMETCFLAYCMGARIIEKHFTAVGEQWRSGNDHYHSADASQFAYLKAAITDVQRYFGTGQKVVQDIEAPARQYARRGLYAARPIQAGQTLAARDIAILRPAARLGPEAYAKMVGSVAAKDYARLEPL